MPQLGTKFPLRCCSKRRWTRSALANQQIMQMRAFLCHSPVFSAKYIHHSSQGSQSSVRALNSTKNITSHDVQCAFSYLVLVCDGIPPEMRACKMKADVLVPQELPIAGTACTQTRKVQDTYWTDGCQKYPGQANTQQDRRNVICS